MGKIKSTIRVFSLLSAVVSVMVMGSAALADSLDDVVARFQPDNTTLQIRYRVAYRLLAFELKQLAEADLQLTGGVWSNRITGKIHSAMLMNLLVDSLDGDHPAETCRASMHSRLVALATLPDVQVLAFGKQTQEWYNPTFGSRSEVHTSSLYSMESGSLQFWKTNFVTGEVFTNLQNTALLEEQSRQILPILTALRDACRGNRPMLSPKDGISVRVSVAEKVVPLEINTYRDQAPVNFAADPKTTMMMTVLPAKGSSVQSRPFRSWIIPYHDVAATSRDEQLKRHLNDSNPEGLVPLAFDYGLMVGSVRCTLTDLKAVTNAPVTLAVSK